MMVILDYILSGIVVFIFFGSIAFMFYKMINGLDDTSMSGQIKSGNVQTNNNTTVDNEFVRNDVYFTESDSVDSRIMFLYFRNLIGVVAASTNLYFNYNTAKRLITFSYTHIIDLSLHVNVMLPPKSLSVSESKCHSLEVASTMPHPLAGETGIDIRESSFIDCRIDTNVGIMKCVNDRFYHLFVAGPEQIHMKFCSISDATFVNSTMSKITFKKCELGRTKIIGPRIAEFYDTDLSDAAISDEVQVVSLYRCIGDGKAIRHLDIGDLFINWTSDRVFISDHTETRFPIAQIDDIMDHLLNNGYDSDAGWIIDYIMNHPAEPFEQG